MRLQYHKGAVSSDGKVRVFYILVTVQSGFFPPPSLSLGHLLCIMIYQVSCYHGHDTVCWAGVGVL